jgi:lysine N6-hydroxylase/L-ornithine N5-oxygenase
MPFFKTLSVDRNYRLSAAAQFKPAIFLQGACESSHGLSDTLLSVTAIRASEITQALINSLDQIRPPLPARTVSSLTA